MSLTRYGIYVAYPPTVDFRHEGLGRYLASFLKGALRREDICLVILCPSWSREALLELCEAEGVPKSGFELVSPDGKPSILKAYEAYLTRRRKVRKSRVLERVLEALRHGRNGLQGWFERKIVTARSYAELAAICAAAIPIGMLLLTFAPLIFIALLLLPARRLFRRVARHCRRRYGPQLERLRRIMGEPKDDGLIVRMYRAMEESEAERMLAVIEARRDIAAWYCPTAFWPAFNRIAAPRLMCVPDVVLRDFPVGFSGLGGERTLSTFDAVESSIQGADHFVTYSETVKWRTLVEAYGVEPSRITVIPHAPNDLSSTISLRGFPDAGDASRRYCESVARHALLKASNQRYAKGFANGSIKFLFYASQLRPNKNVLVLLEAYRNLLQSAKIGHKLIMTGRPNALPEVAEYVRCNNLENDVLFLSGLTVKELASLYHLADLAVNPSLSEGGCPFTFTEALSVSTPVVMARIPVSEELLVDPELQRVTFFDPYDWRDAAERIVWALKHRDQLLEIQRRTYAQLARRTWTDVVDEHLAVLDQLAGIAPGVRLAEVA